MGPREKVYDDKISPLMATIIGLCKEAGIPMVATFELDTQDNGEPLYCSTVLTSGPCPTEDERMLDIAWRTLKRPAPVVIAETVETLPDGSKRLTSRLIGGGR